VDGATQRALGLYVHVPFCSVRCGYCDFNTYTADEVRGVSQQSYPDAAMAEMEWAATVLDQAKLPARPLSTVFFGGGTPTLLGQAPLVGMLQKARSLWGLAPGAEVTTEANPDSVSASDLDALAEGGFTRVSVGVQSVERSVLATLDRTHDPDAVPGVIEAARAAGLQVSVDLIFGTPGETLEQWERTLDEVLSWGSDHISAYALIVEPGTALARRIDRGEIARPDDDVQADMYLAAEEAFTRAGYHWYEISNWATSPGTQSRHNRSYWSAEDWWGIEPGAHSHVGGVRWWNVKHPAAYATRMSERVSPAQAREVLTPDQQGVERILLGLRMREGIPREWVAPDRSASIAELMGRGYLEPQEALAGRLVLTVTGRLVADYVVRELT
jgi:putative oxygen-independent coproporphyrinogen III oxidase